MRTLVAFIVVSALIAPTPALARTQENTRTLEGPGVETKYLTPNGSDFWKIQVEHGETLMVHVTTREFDPVARLVGPGELELIAADDKGSESRFAFRVDAAGEHQIVIHGFEHKGGGNYVLDVRKVMTTPTTIGTEGPVKLDRRGKAYLRFELARDEILVPHVSGDHGTIQCLDPKGKPMSGWAETFRAESAGEHILALEGSSQGRLGVTLRKAQRKQLSWGTPFGESLPPGEMHVWEMSREALDFGLIELMRGSGILARLVHADESDSKELLRRGFDLRALPVLSKGLRQRFASVFGRKSRYELQVLSKSPSACEYGLSAADPSHSIVLDGESATTMEGRLAVGAADFFTFEAIPGQLFRVDLHSTVFDPLLRLYDDTGQELSRNDDGGDDLDSRLSCLVREAGRYRLQVSALGDGGGGDYDLRVEEQAIATIAAGETQTASLGDGDQRYWHFEGEAGETVVISVRSKTCNPSLEVLGPRGVSLGRDQDGGVGGDCLLPLRLDRDGRHTLRVAAQGAGECELRLIDLD